VRNFSSRSTPKETEEAKHNKRAAELREWTAGQKKTFLENFTEKQLIDAIGKYWKGVYGGNPADYGLTLRLFLPIFFLDLHKANGNLNKAIEYGQKKVLKNN